MTSDTSSFAAYVLKGLDTRSLMKESLKLIDNKILTPDERKQEIFNTVNKVSCTDTALLNYVIYPIEELLNYRMPQKEFTKVLMPYYAMSVCRNMTLFPDNVDYYKNHFGGRFFLKTSLFNINTSYRKWQLEKLITEL